MITIQMYVLMLLAISAVSMYLIIGVIIKQIRLMRAPFEMEDEYDDQTRKVLTHFRNVLFVISLTIIIMGLIPITINILTLLIDTGRPHTVKPISYVYSGSVHIQALMLSYLVSRLYRLASNEKKITDFTKQNLKDKLNGKK